MFLKELFFACLIFFGGFMVYACSMIHTHYLRTEKKQRIVHGAKYYIIHGREKCILCFPTGVRTSQDATQCNDFRNIEHQDNLVIAYYNTQGILLKTFSHESLIALNKEELHK